MSDEMVRKAIEEIAEAADYDDERDTPFRLRERLDTIRGLARQALGDEGRG